MSEQKSLYRATCNDPFDRNHGKEVTGDLQWANGHLYIIPRSKSPKAHRIDYTTLTTIKTKQQ